MLEKPGIVIVFPRFGRREISPVVSDLTGTWTREGKLFAGIKERLVRRLALVDVHIAASDDFGMAKEQLEGVREPYILLTRIDPQRLTALGNGSSGRHWLREVKKAGGLALAVENGEGCVLAATNCLDFLLKPKSCPARNPPPIACSRLGGSVGPRRARVQRGPRFAACTANTEWPAERGERLTVALPRR